MTPPPIVIATPVRASEPWAASVSVGYCEMTRKLGCPVIEASVTYAADIVRGRNRLAAMFLRVPEFRDAQGVLWWDDDQWPEGSVDIVGRMLAADEPLIGAPYTNKLRSNVHYVHQLLDDRMPSNGRLEVRCLGFGFTWTSRACLEQMFAAADKYTDYPHMHVVANMFGQLYDEPLGPGPAEKRTLLSEDYSFCKRWRELGGRVTLYAGPGLIRHAGATSFSALDIPGAVEVRRG